MRLETLRAKVDEWRLPYKVKLTDFDPAGVRFEITNMVERHRVVNHGDESDYTRAMLGSLRSDDVLFDIGANVGLVALHAARVCRTVAFEPDVEFAEHLDRNLELNPGIEVDVQRVAVSDADGEVTLFTDGASGNSPSLAHQRGEKQAVTVAARSLDSLWRSRHLPTPTVLKLDIEGAEVLALRGGHQLLSSRERPRTLFIEVHDTFLPAFGSSGGEVRSMLAEFGYTRETYRAARAGQHHLILEHG